MSGSPEDYEAAVALWKQNGSRVHLAGIGGIGMAGLALLMQERGFEVSGCDLKDSALCDTLRQRGIPVIIGHAPAHIANQVALIRSTAVPESAPEIQAARSAGIPALQRGVALAALANSLYTCAVTGTHGKTTTTAMLLTILRYADMRCSWFVGAETEALPGPGGGEGDALLVTEADESDRTLEWYSPDLAVVTNVDADHLEHYGDESALWRGFESFADRSAKLIYNADDERSVRWFASHSQALSFGMGRKAGVRADRVAFAEEGVQFEWWYTHRRMGHIQLPVTGAYHVQNALAACAAALALGVSPDVMHDALVHYRSPRRRFETIVRNDRIHVISDYAHHPSEIRALLHAAQRLMPARCVVVFQPHRYTRTRHLLEMFPPAFAGVDRLFLLPVYPASEKPVEGGTTKDLMDAFHRSSALKPDYCETREQAWEAARKDMEQAGGMLLIVGAGDIDCMDHWCRMYWKEVEDREHEA